MFNLNNHGRPVAIIHGGKYNNKVVSYNQHDNSNEVNLSYCPFTKLQLSDGSKFEPYPNTSQERDIIYCAGPSGSGKTLLLQNMSLDIRRLFSIKYLFYIHIK